jgi:predicted CoA-substrate-specific enzyme activase
MREQAKGHFAGAVGCSGIEIGSVSLKWVRRSTDGSFHAHIAPHEGNAKAAASALGIDEHLSRGGRAVITGRATTTGFDLPYRSEVECIERALQHHRVRPDIVLALGGESFVLYALQGGQVRNIGSPTKCAAGTGEFIRQQLDRMGLSLEEGLRLAGAGRRVRLSTRCSVYCKSDATHKLNKKECEPEDIARTLVDDLADKVSKLVHVAQWPADEIVITGGLTFNRPFIEEVRRRLSRSRVGLVEHGACVEAFGAALLAADTERDGSARSFVSVPRNGAGALEDMPPLACAARWLEFRAVDGHTPRLIPNGEYVLGVDAGSTTTKAVLLNVADGSIGASVYLRTHGNPVAAVQRCLASLREQIAGVPVEVVAAATTGSGRKITSVFLEVCSEFNEIMAHGRAAAEEAPGVDTVFEIGGQDAKFIAFEGGIPIDYAMNEGCSAGTGSFLEEAVGSDLGMPVERISAVAEKSERPIAFGERCAAFINSESRSALQQGSDPKDVVAGMVYSIAKNYLSRVVGVRRIGSSVLFQGGVALNRSVGLALAALLERRIVVPRRPELMGCVGAAQLARDRLRQGVLEKRSYDLARLERNRMEERSSYRCSACDANCEIRTIAVGDGQVFPFGGSCTLHERASRRRSGRPRGTDHVARRNELVLQAPAPGGAGRGRGTVGIPKCLSTYELLPLYRTLLEEMGFRVVVSGVSAEGTGATRGPICYPCEIAHGAVRDLLDRGVDHVFLPHVVEGPKQPGALHSYMCSSTAIIPRVTGAAFPAAAERILAPTLSFSEELEGSTRKQVQEMGRRLGVDAVSASRALDKAFAVARDVKEQCRALGRDALESTGGRPLVILCGRPYVVCAGEVNLGLPGMICERGYDVVSCDMLPMRAEALRKRDVWYHTQLVLNAVEHALARSRTYVVLVSCFSCMPDASMYHVVRERLSDAVFCYLEIDSHTARAGFETRVEAFLDIVDDTEGRVRRGMASRGAR